ncbi:type VII toxin-antitoxin system MntA family adenylyltransferase antitoxin [Pseudomonas indica]|uniref:type VII toxin-antitoxin system MntA family adenylyltransferase antitoxin n=1 Tax=Pseudomonas indica TaxID=137658 RepID=UPI003FD2469A
MNTDPLLEYLRKRLPDLLAVYLFGSHATGTAAAGSDVDLAVLVPGQVEPLRLFEIAGELADLVGAPVDLLDLRAASTVMQFQIITTGRRLWAVDFRAGVFESFILSEKTALDSARSGLLEDIRKEGRIYGR